MGLKEWEHICVNLGLTVENVYVQYYLFWGVMDNIGSLEKMCLQKRPYTYNSPQFPYPSIILCYEHRTHLPITFWHLHHLLHMYGFSDVVNLLGSSPQWRAQASGGAGVKWRCEGTISGSPWSPSARGITIHGFIKILCHVGFSILQAVWASQPN